MGLAYAGASRAGAQGQASAVSRVSPGLERRTLPRSRHWLLKYHATRDYVRQKLIIPKRVPTHDNISDCLTKALELADWNNVGMRMKGYAPIWPYNRL